MESADRMRAGRVATASGRDIEQDWRTLPCRICFMENLRERLVECFTVVFPTLSPESAATATGDDLPDWDSTHHIMLMNVIEEAFHIEIPEEVLGGIDSFQGFESYLAALPKPA